MFRGNFAALLLPFNFFSCWIDRGEDRATKKYAEARHDFFYFFVIALIQNYSFQKLSYVLNIIACKKNPEVFFKRVAASMFGKATTLRVAALCCCSLAVSMSKTRPAGLFPFFFSYLFSVWLGLKTGREIEHEDIDSDDEQLLSIHGGAGKRGRKKGQTEMRGRERINQTLIQASFDVFETEFSFSISRPI